MSYIAPKRYTPSMTTFTPAAGPVSRPGAWGRFRRRRGVNFVNFRAVSTRPDSPPLPPRARPATRPA